MFTVRIAIVALGASAGAIAVARMLLGSAPDFDVEPLAYAGIQAWPFFVVLGGVAGLMATFYNRTLLGAIRAAERLGRWPVELKAGVIGATVGILAWFAPGLVGGGAAASGGADGGGTVVAFGNWLGLLPGFAL